MIGEVRDQETAQIAFRASITGHLVLTTLHTNDASSAVTRLVDLGLQPFMVASALVGVVSMRLVRTLCDRCKEPYEVDAASLSRLGIQHMDRDGLQLYRGVGCDRCHNTGYRGRTGIFEVLEITDRIRPLILTNASDAAIRMAAAEGGMRTMGEDGLKRALAGITTIDEVARVVYLEDEAARICGNCKNVLPKEFDFCPSCGDYVGEHCQSCHRRLNADWMFCAFCGTRNPRVKEAAQLVERIGQPVDDDEEAPGLRKVGT
jgi:hypothetical protein